MEFEDKVRIDRIESKVEKLSREFNECKNFVKIHAENGLSTMDIIENTMKGCLAIIRMQDERIKELENRFKNHINTESAHNP